MKFINLKSFDNLDVEIESNNYIYDFHNNADFASIIYDIITKEVVLLWLYPGDWLLNDNDSWSNKEFLLKHDLKDRKQRKIALVFDLVNLLEIKPRDPEIPFSEDNCLSAIYTDKENELINSLTFDFQSGAEIRINAYSITFNRDYQK
jgi:hypothetical protein